MAALRTAGTTCDSLLAIGGGTQSDFLMQTIATVTSCRIGRSDGAEIGPALGAARLAAVAHGVTRENAIIVKPEVKTWFEPATSETDPLMARLSGFRAMYPALSAVRLAGAKNS
jgi:xylulokinase